MKAQRRQELKTNELAQTLADVKEFLEKYGTYVGGGAIIVVVVLVAGLWWRNSLQTEQHGQWEDLNALQEASIKLLWGQRGEARTDAAAPDFGTLAARHRTLISSATDPQVKLRALSALGDLSWRYARLGPDAGPGTEAHARALDESASAYRQLAGDYADDNWIRGNALVSLAVIAEERGDFDRAEELYNELKSDSAFADSILARSASEALDRLDDLREEIVFAPAPSPPPEPAVPAAPTAEGTTEPAGEAVAGVTEPASDIGEPAESDDPGTAGPAQEAVSEPEASAADEQQPSAAPPPEPSGTPEEEPEAKEPTGTTPTEEPDSADG